MSNKPTNFTILGERCTGTKYLIKLIEANFGLPLTWDFGWKHWYGFADYSHNSDKTLFIGLVRDPIQWIGSFFKEKHHVCPENRDNLIQFLTNEWWSYYDDNKEHGEKYGKEIMEDRHIYTGQRYKNLFEHRAVKSKFLLDEMPKKVKYYILIRYEDILKKPYETFTKISQLINIPLKANNILGHDPHYVPNNYTLPQEGLHLIAKHLDKDTEKRLGYIVRIVYKN